MPAYPRTTNPPGIGAIGLEIGEQAPPPRSEGAGGATVRRRVPRTRPPCRCGPARRRPSSRRGPPRGEARDGAWGVHLGRGRPRRAVVAGLDENAILPVGHGELDRAVGVSDGVGHELGRHELRPKQGFLTDRLSSQLVLDEAPRLLGAREVGRETKGRHATSIPDHLWWQTSRERRGCCWSERSTQLTASGPRRASRTCVASGWTWKDVFSWRCSGRRERMDVWLPLLPRHLQVLRGGSARRLMAAMSRRLEAPRCCRRRCSTRARRSPRRSELPSGCKGCSHRLCSPSTNRPGGHTVSTGRSRATCRRTCI